MPYIPHQDDDVIALCDALGVRKPEEVFSEIPKHLVPPDLNNFAVGETEQSITRAVHELCPPPSAGRCYLGAGAYEHNIPAIVWDLVSRGEFLTAYTPYQAEASQGTLEVIFQFQSMMTKLMQMKICNASVYDGSSALAESILMAIRNSRTKKPRIAVPRSLNPSWRQVCKTICAAQDIEWIMLDVDEKSGRVIIPKNTDENASPITAVVIAQPNFFGICESADSLTDWAHAQGALCIAAVNPLAMSWLKPPGDWGDKGADIVCGDAQPFGLPLSLGGPYCGFICCTQSLCRQLPGRLVGRTKDADGNVGFTLTLQAREQHIRREKARSNICTNQGLLMTAAVITLRSWGGEGLYAIARQSHLNSRWLCKTVCEIPGVSLVFNGPIFHEFVIRVPVNVYDLLNKLREYDIQGGVPLCVPYPALGNAMSVCVTETKTKKDLQHYLDAFRAACQSLEGVQ